MNVTVMGEGIEKNLKVTLGRAELGDRRRGSGCHPYGSMPPGYGHPVHPMPMPVMPYFPGGQPYGELQGET